jgi:formamidopyrimidine-DNA glycosylase
LLFTDQRKFGRIDLVTDPLSILGKLGVEPLSDEFTPKLLKKLAENRNICLKTLLLDQTKIAGIGNIYADEALFYAGLHPQRRAASLLIKEAEKLHTAIIKVLQQGIKNMGTTLGTTNANFYSVAGQRGQNSEALAVFRRNNQPCFHCGTPIQKIRAAGRGTHFCPECQT